MESVDQPTPIEKLSENDLRQEIIIGINDALGNLANGPVADGTGATGYGRISSWWGKGIPEVGSMFPLHCSYARFTKAFERDEQSGVRLELLGIMESGSVYAAIKPEFDEKAKRVSEMSLEEREDFEKFVLTMEVLKVAIDKDGLVPAENRYYFIPSNPLEPAIVSTESFISRAHRANPEATERVLLPETISEALEEQKATIDPISGQPTWRAANLQDLRDATTIVRGYKNFIKEIIQKTPSNYWGRPGLTE